MITGSGADKEPSRLPRPDCRPLAPPQVLPGFLRTFLIASARPARPSPAAGARPLVVTVQLAASLSAMAARL